MLKKLTAVTLLLTIYSSATTGICGDCAGCSTFYPKYTSSLSEIKNKIKDSEKKIAQDIQELSNKKFLINSLDREIAVLEAKIAEIDKATYIEMQKLNTRLKKEKQE